MDKLQQTFKLRIAAESCDKDAAIQLIKAGTGINDSIIDQMVSKRQTEMIVELLIKYDYLKDSVAQSCHRFNCDDLFADVLTVIYAKKCKSAMETG